MMEKLMQSLENNMSFEEDLKKLEQLTERLRDDSTGLEESLKIYEEATLLTKKLNKTLEETKRKIEEVSKDGSVTSRDELGPQS
ncbi:exodeoxyribonuclease VII small subunit [Spirochaetales bacterium NM-380-WT-3C1]|uniref:Exodeoxyribonuclease 7 small subunit n=2 Tax=Bullifex porci TaxID=2606638 RepID=A0A7X2PCY8_9SPIO|nr:exodeoxyribonuclease VII small subunit [Bullifex porci]